MSKAIRSALFGCLLMACAGDEGGDDTPLSDSSVGPVVVPPTTDAASATSAIDAGTGGNIPTSPVDAGRVVVDAGGADMDSGGGALVDSGGSVAVDSGGVQGDAGAAEGGVTPPPGAIQRGPATLDYVAGQGPYMVQSYTSGYRDGPQFADATIFYPTGDAVPPFALVAVVPGYMTPQSGIRSWGPKLASHGFVTITIGTNTTSVSNTERGAALMDALETLKGENTRQGSPLLGKLNTTALAVMGHSLGGGGTLVAAQNNPTMVKAAVPLQACAPGGFSGNRITAATLVITSSGDATCSPDTNRTYYTGIPSTTKKAYFRENGGRHGSTIGPTGVNGMVGAYAVAWYKAFLEGDTRYIPILKMMPAGTMDYQNNL
jgi:dienelactone hydrolase